MRVLLDTGPTMWDSAVSDISNDVEIGQLLTPLTRYADRGLPYAIDNGAYSRFDSGGFLRLLSRMHPSRDRCLFVASPDVVASARRTLESLDHWYPRLDGWPIALVCQDGQEDLPIPWELISAVFIGGSTAWKISSHAEACIRAAQVMGKYTHVGRVNTPARFDRFASLGVDSIDGTGISRYTHMRQDLMSGNELFSGAKT